MSVQESFSSYPPICDIFLALQEKEHAVFLDSSLQGGDRGRFSILACRPYLTVEEKDSVCFVNDSPIEESLSEFIRAYLLEHKEEPSADLPITSGAVGYFSYDFGREKEGVASSHPKMLDIPECILRFYDCFIIEDHQKQILTVAASGKTADPYTLIREIRQLIEHVVHITSEQTLPYQKDASVFRTTAEQTTLHRTDISGLSTAAGQAPMIQTKDTAAPQRHQTEPSVFHTTVEADFSGEDYMNAVDHMIRYIVDGDIYVVNMTHQLRMHSDCPPLTLFRRLRKQNPSPFGGYLDYGDFQIVCASPERFMKLTDGLISTRPIKGTRRRGNTPEEDRALKEELAHSEKDQSELLMIVDLERNDLNRVCIPGSVQVTELFKVETYATVFHLESNVIGKLKPENTAIDLIQAAFPGGSITGAPKLRAMELIDQEERSRRNLYTGSIGYLSLSGDCDLNIVIRTAIHKDGVYHLGVGGGITCESDLEFEYEETWQKARALLHALDVKNS